MDACPAWVLRLFSMVWMRHVSYGRDVTETWDRPFVLTAQTWRSLNLLPVDAEECLDRRPVCVPVPSRPRFSNPDLWLWPPSQAAEDTAAAVMYSIILKPSAFLKLDGPAAGVRLYHNKGIMSNSSNNSSRKQEVISELKKDFPYQLKNVLLQIVRPQII